MRTLRPNEVDAILADEPKGCTMCAIARGESDHARRGAVARGPHASCVLDRFAVRRGHLLVVLDRHVERVADLAWEEWESVQRLAWEATRAIEAVLHPARVYVAALGSAVPLERTFPHVHVHVIPIFDGGEADRPSEILTWKNGVLVYDEGEDDALVVELTRAWPAR